MRRAKELAWLSALAILLLGVPVSAQVRPGGGMPGGGIPGGGRPGGNPGMPNGGQPGGQPWRPPANPGGVPNPGIPNPGMPGNPGGPRNPGMPGNPGGAAGMPGQPGAGSPWTVRNPLASSNQVMPGAPIPIQPAPVMPRTTIGPEWQQAQALIQSGNHPAAQQIINQQLQRDPSLAGMMSTVSAMQRANVPSPAVQALRQQTLQMAQTHINQGAAQPLPYVVVAQYALEDRNDHAFRQATQALTQRFPDSEYAAYYTGIRQLQDQDYKGAEQSLRRARALGMPEESIAELLRIAIDSQRWIWQYATIIMYILIAWLVGLALLFVAGKVLSALTLRSLARVGPEVASAGDRALRRTYRFVVNAAGLYYYLSLPIVVVAAVALPLALGYALLRVPVLNLGLVALVLIGGIAGILTGLSGVRAAFCRLRDGDIGRSVSPQEAPRLWEVTREVAQRVGTRCVDEIRITPGTELAVTEGGGFLARMRDRGRRVLILGLGGMQGMKLDALKCVQAHEYGHFVHRDTAGGDIALRVNVAMMNFAQAIQRRGKIRWWDIAVQFLRLYHYLFRRLTFGASRQQEVLADRVAVGCYGRNAFVEGLTHVIRRSIEFEVALIRAVRHAVHGRPALAFYSPDAVPELAEREQIEAVVRSILMRPTDADDSHPSPKDRFELAARVAVADRPPGPENAWDLLAENNRLLHDMGKQLETAIEREVDKVEALHGVMLRQLAVALRYQPRRPDALLERARIYMRQGKYAEAVEDLTPILNMFPNNGEIRLARAMAYKGLEQYRLAAEDLVQVIRILQVQRLPGQDQFNLYATLAHCQARCGQAEAAVRTYSRALEVQPRSLLALVERGQAQRELGNYDGALTDFSTAVEHWPTSPEALLERAAAYEALGDNTPAGLDREAARQLDPRLTPAEPAESYWNDVRL